MLWEYVYIGSEMVRNSIIGLCHTWPTKESQGKTNHNVPKPVRDVRKNSPTKASASKKKDTRKGTTLLEEARGLGIFLALEPRIMFDGAALLTGAEVIQDATAQDQTVFPGIDGETSTDTNTNDFSDSDALWSSGFSFAAPSDRKEIVFIDTRVEDYQTLMEGIDPNADVILLDSTRDGVEQIAEVLAGRNDIDAIHLIAEGNEAELHLGSTFITQESISGQYTNLLTQIGQSLSTDADLLIYGCNFGQGEAGQNAMETLAELTGADIAASTDRTGHLNEYADWELEIATGKIETSIVIGEATQETWEGVLATYTVTNTNDSGAGSLRQALIDADALPGTDTIIIPIGTYTLTTGQIEINDDVIITGAGASTTIIDGNGTARVFETRGPIAVTMSGITIQGGFENSNGAGVFVDNSSTFNLSDAILANNDGTGGDGGAFHVRGTLNLDRVLIDNNVADKGGAIYFQGANGGTLTNVTISGNTAFNEGGGVWTDNPITITNSTIAFNTAPNGGGVFDKDGMEITITNSILHNPGSPNSDGVLISGGNNIDSDSTAGLGDPLDGFNPMLAGLADNGGPTQTHALLAGSPAINAGTTAGAPAVDQRNITRDEIPDIGAFESTTAASKVYWAEDGSNAIFRSNTDGSAKQQILSGLGSPTGLDVDVAGGKIYWIETATRSLHRANLDGTNVENLDATNLVNPIKIGLDVVNSHIYVADDGNGADDAIRRFNLDGTGFTTIVNNLNGIILDVAVDPAGSKLYFADFGTGFSDGKIRSTDIGGGPIQDIVTGQEGPTSLALDATNGKIYWTDNGGVGFDSIKRADLDGQNIQTVSSAGLQNPTGIAIDSAEGKVYWSDQSSNFVRRSDLNGTNDEDVVTGLNSPREIAVIRLGGVANTAPTVDLDANNSSGASGNDYTVSFTEGDGPTAIADSDTDLVDVDSLTFPFVNLVVNGLLDGNAEVLVLDGDTFALATAVAGQDTSGGNYHVIVSTGAGAAKVSITKQGGGLFTEVETETLITTIQYQHTDTSTPTNGDRLLDVFVNDGTWDSAAARTTINVNPINDPPTATIAPFSYGLNEDDSYRPLGGVSVSDSDAGTNDLSVTLSVNDGSLRLGTTTGLTFASGANDSTTMTVTGTTTNLNNALATLSYQPDQDFAGSDLLTLSIDDLGNTGGGSLTDMDTANIIVAPINDPPTFNGLDNTPTFIEGGVAVIFDNNVTIADPELDATNDYSGATLTLVRNGGANADDLFNGSGTLNPLLESGSLVVGGTTIGTVTTNSGGTLVLTFNSNTTTALVNSALQQITYANTNGTPPPSVQIDFTINDGNAGGQGSGGALNDTGSITVTITAANTAPTVDLDANNSSGVTGNDYTFTFTEGDSPTAIADSDTDLVDVDSPTFDYVKLSVSDLLDGNAETLVLDGDTFALGTAVAGQDTTGGNYHVVITTGAGTATVSITKQGGGLFSEVETETLIKAIQYQHTDTIAPTNGDRLIDVTVNDGTWDSAVARTTINVNPVNDTPVHTVPGTQTIPEETQTAIAGLSVADVDAAAGLISTRLQVTNGLLDVTLAGAATIDEFRYYSAGASRTNDLTIQGTVADVNATLASLRYTGNSNVTGVAADTLTMTTSDGGNTGTGGAQQDVDTIQIDLTNVNDAPIITSNGGGASAAITVIEGNTAVTDVNAFDAEGSLLTYSLIGGADAAKFSIDPTTGVLIFNTAPDSEAPGDVGSDNVYNVVVQVSDGTAVDTQAIAVTITKAPPVFVPPPPPDPTPDPTPPPTDGNGDDGESEDETSEGGVPVVASSPGNVPGGDQGSPTKDLRDSDADKNFGANNLSAMEQRTENTRLGNAVNEILDLLRKPFDSSAIKGEIQAVLTRWGFLEDLDRVRDAFQDVTATEQTYLASSVAASTGLSIGYVFWLLRSGVLLTALLTSLPAWQFVNPLLVLDRPEKKNRKNGQEDPEDDSVESMFENPSVSAETSKTKTDLKAKEHESRWSRRT